MGGEAAIFGALFRVLGGGIPVAQNIFRGICKIIVNYRSRQYCSLLLAIYDKYPSRLCGMRVALLTEDWIVRRLRVFLSY